MSQGASEIKENIQSESAEQGEVSHEATLFAESIFHVGNFTITNSLLNSWLELWSSSTLSKSGVV